MVGVSAYRAAALLARRTGDPVAIRGAHLIGRAAAQRNGAGTKMIARNLRRVLGRPLGRGETRRRVARTYAWYVRYYLESFKLPGMEPEIIDREFSYSGVDAIHANCGPGTDGAILALPHLGTWEWAAHWLALVADVQVTAVVEKLEPPSVFEWFAGLRKSLGMEIHPLGPGAGQAVVAALKRGHLVCLLCDRDLEGTGVAVEFFGERTTLPAGPAMLALRLGVPLIPAAVYWRDHGRHGLARPPLVVRREGRLRDDVARITQSIAHEFEGLIRLAPEQWHLLKPNWPSDYKVLNRPVPSHLAKLSP